MLKAIDIDPACCVCIHAYLLTSLHVCLQLEDTSSSPDVPVERDDATASQVRFCVFLFFNRGGALAVHCVCACFQMEELIKEVQVLRVELRSRDKTIAQLTLQLQQHQQVQMVSWCEHG